MKNRAYPSVGKRIHKTTIRVRHGKHLPELTLVNKKKLALVNKKKLTKVNKVNPG